MPTRIEYDQNLKRNPLQTIVQNRLRFCIDVGVTRFAASVSFAHYRTTGTVQVRHWI